MFGFREIFVYISIIFICNLLFLFSLFKQKNADLSFMKRFNDVIDVKKDIDLFVDLQPKIVISKVSNKTFLHGLLKILFSFDNNSEICSFGELKKILLLVFSFFALIFIFVSSYISFNFFIFLVFIFVWVGCVKFYFSRKVNIFRKNLIEQLPDTVFMMARSLKIGVSLSRTLELVARQSPEPTKYLFEDVVKKIAVGKDFGEVLDDLSIKAGINEYKFFSIIAKLQSRTGGGLADILDGFGKNIRKRISTRKKAVALAAEARMSCYVLSALPIFMAFVLGVMNPQYISVLYRTDSGLKLLYIAIILFFSGVFSMFFVTKITLR